MKPLPGRMTYEQLADWIQERKRSVWMELLEREPDRRLQRRRGGRPRDPEQEALLLELDRLRATRDELLKHARRVPTEPQSERT